MTVDIFKLTILTNGTGSTKDKNGVSSVLSSALGRYRWNQSKTSRVLVVQTNVRRREGDRQSSSFIVRNVGRNLRDALAIPLEKSGTLLTFATVEAYASAYC